VTAIASAADNYAAAFDTVTRDAPVPDRVQALRRAGFERFAALGFPTTKNEDWHYTSVSPIAEEEFTVLTARTDDALAAQLDPFYFRAEGWPTAVFVNGRFSPQLSSLAKLPKGVRIETLADSWSKSKNAADQIGHVASTENYAFTALNTALMYDGALVEIAKDAEIPGAIHLLYVTDATAAKGQIHPRTAIIAGKHSKATIIESYVSTSDAKYFTNAVTEVSVADGANLSHYKIQREGMRAFHVGTIEVRQARDSHYQSFSLALGAELSRTNVYTTLDGENCGATLNGLYMVGGEQHCDHQTQIIHAQPNCFSRELYKGILDGRSHGVFNGKVYVHPIAQKTDGKQTNKTLLLSDQAVADTKPQLEIFADDVKCTHGATIGQIDQQALFYMKSRGIDKVTATKLLTYAFAADVLETIELEPLKHELERLTLERFTSVSSS
jgi:Fe-S cluster assembly protein SufD